MKTRHVFTTPDVRGAEDAVDALRRAGIPKEDISLIASDSIEKQAIPDDHQETSGDFAGGGVKGLVGGGASGLLAGIVAVTIAPLGLTLAGVAAMTLVGAAVGGWMGMLTGTEEPDTVRRTFEDEIAAGHVLVVVDGDKEMLARADAALAATSATPLPYDKPTLMS
ncbi:hypothetical protein UU9_06429 [Rhodanobacter fulvus Jip2]|jgi:hypothetical protein|uniref:Transmembrane protein n=1 Tax=Rhodanobacter fulvus Jip2 TaxID=1163408 RepID=I4VT79_9GAMM|nr:hypothetical protein [Rhodanobacter fulvus]EIL90420.1 hypothetical protein UU9_06429 [Rhodanobacter fulvus Jip2]